MFEGFQLDSQVYKILKVLQCIQVHSEDIDHFQTF